MSFRPILGPTEELAWERAHRILQTTKENVADFRARRRRETWGLGGSQPPNVGSQRLLAAAEKGELHDRALWTPLAAATGAAGNSTALVGTPETVAQAILDYIDIGVTTILIRGYDPYNDAIDYGRHLLPLVREEVARRDAEQDATASTGGAGMTARQRQLKLGAVTMGAGGPGQHYLWLDPEIPGDASVNVNWYIEQARLAEAAKFDLIFIVDSQFITPDSPPHYLNRLEPITLLSALAVTTQHLGLVATMTTSYNDPFNLARRLASLDLISGGRSGWNVVTSGDAGAAANFCRDEHFDYDTRYARGLEFVRVAQGLWDSYEEDAFPRDRATRTFLDPSQAAPAQPPGRALPGRRPAQRVPLAAGPAGDLPGGRLRAGPRPRRHDRRGHLHPRRLARAGPGLLRRHQVPRRRQGPRPRPPGGDAGHAGLRRRHRRRGARDRARPPARRPGLRQGPGRARPPVRLARLPPVRPGRPVPAAGAGATPSAASAPTRRRSPSSRRDNGFTLRQTVESISSPRPTPFAGAPATVADQITRWFDARALDGLNYHIANPAQWRRFREEVVPILQERGIVRPSTTQPPSAAT